MPFRGDTAVAAVVQISAAATDAVLQPAATKAKAKAKPVEHSEYYECECGYPSERTKCVCVKAAMKAMKAMKTKKMKNVKMAHSGGVTPVVQGADTDLNEHIRRKYTALEAKFKARSSGQN